MAPEREWQRSCPVSNHVRVRAPSEPPNVVGSQVLVAEHTAGIREVVGSIPTRASASRARVAAQPVCIRLVTVQVRGEAPVRWWVNPNGAGAGCEPVGSGFDSRHSPQGREAAVLLPPPKRRAGGSTPPTVAKVAERVWRSGCASGFQPDDRSSNLLARSSSPGPLDEEFSLRTKMWAVRFRHRVPRGHGRMARHRSATPNTRVRFSLPAPPYSRRASEGRRMSAKHLTGGSTPPTRSIWVRHCQREAACLASRKCGFNSRRIHQLRPASGSWRVGSEPMSRRFDSGRDDQERPSQAQQDARVASIHEAAGSSPARRANIAASSSWQDA